VRQLALLSCRQECGDAPEGAPPSMLLQNHEEGFAAALQID
jgi:hypothetical protein